MMILQPAPSLASQLPQGMHCTHYLWEPAAGDADPATCPIAGKPAPTRPALHPLPVGAGLPAMLTLQPAPSLACAAPDTCGSRLAGDADSATRPIPGKPSPIRPALHPLPVGAGLPAMLPLQPAPSLACAAPDTFGSRLAGDDEPATCPIPGLCCTHYLWEPACRRC